MYPVQMELQHNNLKGYIMSYPIEKPQNIDLLTIRDEAKDLMLELAIQANKRVASKDQGSIYSRKSSKASLYAAVCR